MGKVDSLFPITAHMQQNPATPNFHHCAHYVFLLILYVILKAFKYFRDYRWLAYCLLDCFSSLLGKFLWIAPGWTLITSEF